MPVIQTNGTTISYERTGTGRAVLLIQGVGAIGNCWRPQVEGLRQDFTLVTVDNRGIGGSAPGREPLSVGLMAEDALAIMTAEKIDRFHVAGHSMGGLIAQALALDAPSRVLSLALLCTFARGRDATALTWAIVRAGLRTRIGSRAMRRRAFLDLIMPGVSMPANDANRIARDLEPLFGHDLADQPPIAMKQLRATSKYEAGPRLAELASIPTIVISAERDIIARPSSGRALAASIPGASFVELAGLGHGSAIQEPDRVNDLLRAHWNAHACARTAGDEQQAVGSVRAG
jgi:pimeloyl-ACP methyl ester carboxylesterase